MNAHFTLTSAGVFFAFRQLAKYLTHSSFAKCIFALLLNATIFVQTNTSVSRYSTPELGRSLWM